MEPDDLPLMQLLGTIAAGDEAAAQRLLAASPALATERVAQGATRESATAYFLVDIGHYAYAGDTALHIAAAAYQRQLAQALVSAGADVGAKNRRGAQPLHYAADGGLGSGNWNPQAQAATITYLIQVGADPNATDKSGVAPLHRAVRTRCAAAVSALLDGGAQLNQPNRRGSTPMKLATRGSGRGGGGSAGSKTQQAEIVGLLELHGATTRLGRPEIC